MARTSTADEQKPTNLIGPTTARRFVGEIHRHMESLATLRGKYMSDCKDVRDLIKEVKDRAHDAGLPRSSLNLYLREVALEQKLEALRDDVEPDVTELADAIRAALGDFAESPLGRSAVATAEETVAKRSRKKSAALDDLADKKDADAERVAENARRLSEGVKELH